MNAALVVGQVGGEGASGPGVLISFIVVVFCIVFSIIWFFFVPMWIAKIRDSSKRTADAAERTAHAADRTAQATEKLAQLAAARARDEELMGASPEEIIADRLTPKKK